MGWFAPAAAAISGGSGILSSIFSYNTARDANQANILENAKQMQFQERMSSSAYQRATADMRAAGINPMLAADQGGASSPSGAAATIEPTPSPIEGLGSSSIDVMRMLQDVSESDSRKNLNNNLADKALADAGLARTSAGRGAASEYIEQLKLKLMQRFLGTADKFHKYLSSPKDRNKTFMGNPNNSEGRIPGSYLDILP